MESSTRVSLPSAPWKYGVPKAIVCPMIHWERLGKSDGRETSTEIHTAPSNFTSEATQRPSTDSSVSVNSPTEPLSRIAADQESGQSGHSRPAWRPKLTVPRTPTVLKRRSTSQRPMSSEELEMEMISLLQKETAEHIKRNEVTIRRSIAGPGQHMRSFMPLTRPMNNQLHTNRPTRAHTPSSSYPEYKEFNFIKELRNYPPSAHVIRALTVPKPFNLSCCRKRECEDVPIEKYVSIAEYINMFVYRTQEATTKSSNRRRQINESISQTGDHENLNQ